MHSAAEIRKLDEEKRFELHKNIRKREAVSKRKQLLKRFINFGTISGFVLVIGVCALIVYNHVQLHEVTSSLNRLSKEISDQESENVRLASLLENTISLHVIAEIAQRELGLQKLDKYQIEYVSIYKENTIELTNEAPREDFTARLSYSVNNMFSHIKEYIAAP